MIKHQAPERSSRCALFQKKSLVGCSSINCQGQLQLLGCLPSNERRWPASRSEVTSARKKNVGRTHPSLHGASRLCFLGSILSFGTVLPVVSNRCMASCSQSANRLVPFHSCYSPDTFSRPGLKFLQPDVKLLSPHPQPGSSTTIQISDKKNHSSFTARPIGTLGPSEISSFRHPLRNVTSRAPPDYPAETSHPSQVSPKPRSTSGLQPEHTQLASIPADSMPPH